MHPEAFSQSADIVVLGAFNEAIGTFCELLSGWANGQIAGLDKIKGVYAQDTGYTGFRLPTLGKPVDWEEFCKLAHMRLSDYEDKHLGLLFLPLRISPFSCPNFVNPLISNIKDGTELDVGCNFCGVAYEGKKVATELRRLNRQDLIDTLVLSEENFESFLLKARKEVKSALNQLCKEKFSGRTEIYDCDHNSSPLKIELFSRLMKSEYRGQKIKDCLGWGARASVDLLDSAIEKLEEEGLMKKFGFEVEVHYGSTEEAVFSNANINKSDLKSFIASLRKYKDKLFWGYFFLTSPRSRPRDFAENIDLVLRSIGVGITHADAIACPWIGNNRLSEEYSTPYSVSPEIRPTVEEYIYCLNSWLEGKSLSQAISENESIKNILEKAFLALGRPDEEKRNQVLNLRSTINRLLNAIQHRLRDPRKESH